MVHVIFKLGSIDWESPETRALGSATDALYQDKVLDYLGLTGRENIFIKDVRIERLAAVTEEALEEKPPPGLTILDIAAIRTVGEIRELLSYKVQFMCDIEDVFYNIIFYIDMIWTKNVKSIKSVSIELLQKVPAGMSISQASVLPGYSKPMKVLR